MFFANDDSSVVEFVEFQKCLEEFGLFDENASEEDMRKCLKIIIKLCIGNFGNYYSDIANHGHYLVTLQSIYDPAVYLTEAE